MKKNYVVVLSVTQELTYEIDAVNSPEEAEGLAEGLFEMGEEPQDKETIEVVAIDSYPQDDDEEEETV